MKLEPRLLFDAAVAGAVADVAAQVAADGGAEPAPEPAVEPVALPPPEAAVQADQVNVLLVSSNIDNADALANAASENVIVIQYDYKQATLDSLHQKIEEALDGRKADTISFATEGQSGLFYLLDGMYVTADTLEANSDLAQFWTNIGTVLSDEGRVDLLGCFTGGLDGNDYGLLGALEALIEANGNDIEIAASTDMTGSDRGNWILEVGNIDASTYFNAQRLANWSGDLATFTVTNTNDSGAGSLRSAIGSANSSGGFDTVEFDIAANSVINLNSIINVGSNILIDGTTATGYDFGTTNMVNIVHTQNSLALAGTNITVQGLHFSGATSNFAALFVFSGSSTIRENVFNDSYAGILAGGSGSIIQGNYIGTDVTGTSSGGMVLGLDLLGGNHTIGGDTAAERNIISGSSFAQFFLRAQATIQGNYIGTDVTGTNDITGGHGIYVLSTTGTINVGGSNPGEGNLISGNNNGIWVTSNATLNITGNLIGTDPTGTSTIGNSGHGILANTGSLTIGGDTAAERNIISGNGSTGIRIDGGGTHLIEGNYIGIDITGTVDLGNGTHGIRVSGGASTTIGGDTAGERNIISGNDLNGIVTTDGNNITIQGNYIGTDVNGTSDLGNGTEGVSITGGTNILVTDNVISGNGAAGIIVTASDPTIQNNLIGTDASGLNPIANDGNGISVTGGTGTTIGGTGAANTIAYNSGDGVQVDGATNNPISRNSIFDNDGIGISLVNGGNDSQEAPILNRADYDPNTDLFTIEGTFNGTIGQSYTLEFFGNPVDNGGGVEGKVYLGSLIVIGTGSPSPFTFNLAGQPAANLVNFTATATNGTTNNTSEFSSSEPLNTEPVLQNNAPATVIAGRTVTITPQNLLVTDAEQPAGEITYTITRSPQYGQFEYVNAPNEAIDSFTQADINNGLVRYRHFDTTLLTDSPRFSVSDGHGGEISVQLNILVTRDQGSEPQPNQDSIPQQSRYSYRNTQNSFDGIANGFFNVEGENQLSSFGNYLGYALLSNQGDNAISFRIVNAQPRLANNDRNTGYGDAVDALEHAISYWGIRTETALVNDTIEELSALEDIEEDLYD